MKRIVLVAAATGAFLGAAQAQGFISFTFDEFGAGIYTTSAGVVVANPGVLMPDPTGSGIALALTFSLPNPVGLGDIGFRDTDPAETHDMSEVLRFYADATMHYHMIFYSDNVGGVEAPADVGLPVNFQGPVFEETFEPGTGNWLCIKDYGFPADNRYIGISEGRLVPEPASMLAMGFGLAALARKRRKRG